MTQVYGLRQQRWSQANLSPSQRFVPALLREILIGHRADESLECGCSNGGESHIACRRVGAAVGHGGTDLDARWVAIRDEATGFSFQDVNEFTGRREISRGAMEGGGELASEGRGQVE